MGGQRKEEVLPEPQPGVRVGAGTPEGLLVLEVQPLLEMLPPSHC